MINKYYSCLQILFHINYWITKFQQYLPQCLTSTSWAIFLRDELGSLCRRGTHPRNSNAANTKIQKHQTKNEPKKKSQLQKSPLSCFDCFKKNETLCHFMISSFALIGTLTFLAFHFFHGAMQFDFFGFSTQQKQCNAIQFNFLFLLRF